MTTTALWAGLLPWLRKIGRWLIERLVEKGTAWLLAVMDDRIDAFTRRRAKTKLAWRKRWLRGRIDRWTKAQTWLRNRSAATIVGEMRRAYNECLLNARAERIPLVSPMEKEPRAPRRAAA